jgi:hypothetical protein
MFSWRRTADNKSDNGGKIKMVGQLGERVQKKIQQEEGKEMMHRPSLVEQT